MSVLDFFKPAPYLPEMQDQEAIKKKYGYWRWRIFLSMYLGYAFYYLTRKSLPAAMPILSKELNLSMAELGWMVTIFSVVYGASKLFNGILGDKSNPRYLMSIGLILTGVCNFFFGLSSAFWAFALFWGLNGWLQGWGWPGCAKLLTHWYSQSERGRWWSLWNTSHNVGGVLIPLIAAFCAQYFGWRYAMYVPGVICVAVGIALMFFLRDTPQSMGLPSIEKFRNDYPPSQNRSEPEKESLPVREILFKYVFRNKFVWVLGIAYFFIYVIRTALSTWSSMYLVQVKGYSVVAAAFCVTWFEIGGFFGSLAAGWVSDTLFQARRNPVNILFTLGVLAVMGFFWFLPASPFFDGLFQFSIGFFTFGPQMMIGMAVAELSHKKSAATAVGFAGCFAYLGAGMAGGPFGALIESYGWNSLFVSVIVCTLIGLLILLPLWGVDAKQRKAEVSPAV